MSSSRSLEIWTEVLPDGWLWSPDNYVGGTHEFVVNTAKCAKFENVLVYYDGPAGEYDGVFYLPRSAYKGNDVVLVCNSIPEKLGKYNIYWSNWYGEKEEDYQQFDERIVQSPFHQDCFGHETSRMVPLSCWPDNFKKAKKKKGQCLYSSSPDRGGEFLKKIWPEVSRETGAELIMTYTTDISEEEMIELYKSSEFWLHPCEGVELFCVAAAKAQCAGCIPVVVPNMALETTVKYGIRTTMENYKEDLIKAIKNPPQPDKVDFGSWQTVTDELFKNVYD
jgi:glycosyltransferase involved in cell wall biosynthesis